jgi:glutamate-1-semialdehyde 2,1-aminomutase
MPKNMSFEESSRFLLKAEKIIPLGSQTFSKSYVQYPQGVSPLFAKGAKGAKVWDIDGNAYVDLVNSLAAITAGYKNRKVDRAVNKQLRKGVIYSLPGSLEFDVAEKICELVPSAEMVRFAKNGTDATSAAIRLARAFTGKKHIAICGYHGWQDWFIGTTSRNKGVPKEVSDLSHTFQYNNINSLEEIFSEFPGQIAAVILEPMTKEFPKNDFLKRVKDLTKQNNSILVFDETITGFRFAEGGAQELFNVVPDLTTLGKGIANGYPLSAIVGNREIMSEMKEIFFSGTFGGELLSLAAANVMLDMHLNRKIVPKLIQIGDEINNKVTALIEQHNLSNLLNIQGHSSWKILSWSGNDRYSIDQIRTLFLQEMLSKGVLIIGSHNISTAMTSRNITKVVDAYDQSLQVISKGLREERLEKLLRTPPVVPLFQVR